MHLRLFVAPLASLLFCAPAYAQVTLALDKVPLSFEAVEPGAAGAEVYVAKGPGYNLKVQATQATLVLGGSQEDLISSRVLSLKLVGADAAALPRPLHVQQGKSHYFHGSDPTQWRTGVAHYGQVSFDGVYRGIDLVYYGKQRQLEYDFLVSPGADHRAIEWELEGAESVALGKAGELVLKVGGKEVRFKAPISYVQGAQSRPLASRYVLRGERRVGFEVDGYDGREELVIDPLLDYSTYLGGTGNDYGYAIAVDAAGAVYVAGQAGWAFPTLAGALQTSPGGSNEIFVSKLSADGSTLLYSTYLGGSGQDNVRGIAVDASGQVVLAGYTDGGYPTTAGAIKSAPSNSYADAVVTKLSSDGGSLIYSTCLGGTLSDVANDVALDSAGNAYVVGNTQSNNFPTTAGAAQTAWSASSDAFVSKLNSDGTALLYSTYLGGTGYDEGNGIALDLTGNAYVTGTVPAGSSMPATTGVFRTGYCGGSSDAWAGKLDSAGALAYLTYLGGAGNDIGKGIAVNTVGQAFVTGSSTGSFPVTVGAYQTTFSGSQDVVVAELAADGSALVYATYLGGTGLDQGYRLAIDSDGRACVVGSTNWYFPVTAGSNGFAGNSDAFVSKFSVGGGSLEYSTCLGGTYNEVAYGLALDSTDHLYVTGYSSGSGIFPTTSGAYLTVSAGVEDAFVVKLLPVAPTPTPSPTPSFTRSPSYTCSPTASPSATTTPTPTALPTTVPVPPCYETKWGGSGSGDGQFSNPFLAACAQSGDVYVTDLYNYRVQRFASDGTFKGKWGSFGSGDGQFNYPYGVAVGPDGSVYVADAGLNRIQKFTADGTFVAKWGSLGSGDGQLSTPYGLATDAAGDLLVADYGNRRVQKFDAEGAFLAKWGSSGTCNGCFDGPAAIAVAQDGSIYVGEQVGNRVQKFTAAGAFVAKWGSYGSGPGQFDQISGMAVDPSGALVVGDYSNRLQWFTSSGTFLYSFGASGSGNGQFNIVNGVAFGPDGKLFVVDFNNNRVQRLGACPPTPTPSDTPSPTPTSTPTATPTPTPAPTSRTQPFTDDFSTDQGWTYAGEWERGPATASCCQTAAYADPADDHSASADDQVAGTVIGGNIAKVVHPLQYLESPAVDLSGTSAPQLRFWRWLNTDQPGWHNNSVEVWDGAQWVTLFTGQGTDSAWVEKVYDLTPYKNAALKVRFGSGVGFTAGLWDASGWNLDDVYIGEQYLSPTPTASPSATPSATPTPSSTATPSASPTETGTPSPTETSSPSPSATGTSTESPTLSATPSGTPTVSPSPSGTCTASPTASPSATVSATPTPNATLTSVALSWTPTPAYPRNELGLSVVAGPVPARSGQPLCLYFGQAPKGGGVELYDLVGERVAAATFGLAERPCLSTSALAPGIYFLRLKSGDEVRWQKVAIVP